MTEESQNTPITRRYFVSYSGIKLPLHLVNEIPADGLHTRNTYFCGHFDANGRLVCCQKIVYDEVECEHLYTYHANGALKLAQITEDEQMRELSFAEDAP
jgi:hypothetical protein